MKPRGQFEARPKSAFAGGVLYYAGTQNRFHLPELFDFSLLSGYKLWEGQVGTNWSLQAILNQAPPAFNMDNFYPNITYNNPQPTTGRVMIVDFTYKVLGGGSNNVIAQFSTKTSIKIVVQ
jgi:hypothetical protein